MGLNVRGHAPLRLPSPWDAERLRLDPNLEHLIRHGFVSMAPMQNDGLSFIAWQLRERKEDEPIGGMRAPQWSSPRYRWLAAEDAAESEFTAGQVVQNDSDRLFLGSSLLGLVPGSATKEMIGCRQRGHGMAPAGFADV
jgi:hypothetical protein